MISEDLLRDVVVTETGGGKFMNRAVIGEHAIMADEPRSAGGDETGPSPYDFLLISLGTCTSMTLRMYADRKGWPLETVQVRLSHGKVHAKDCEECETQKGKVDQIEREIKITGNLDDEQRTRLFEIADKCPVHRTLTSEINIVTRRG